MISFQGIDLAGPSAPYLAWAVGFLCGFSERFAQDFVVSASGRLVNLARPPSNLRSPRRTEVDFRFRSGRTNPPAKYRGDLYVAHLGLSQVEHAIGFVDPACHNFCVRGSGIEAPARRTVRSPPSQNEHAVASQDTLPGHRR